MVKFTLLNDPLKSTLLLGVFHLAQNDQMANRTQHTLTCSNFDTEKGLRESGGGGKAYGVKWETVECLISACWHVWAWHLE